MIATWKTEGRRVFGGGSLASGWAIWICTLTGVTVRSSTLRHQVSASCHFVSYFLCNILHYSNMCMIRSSGAVSCSVPQT